MEARQEKIHTTFNLSKRLIREAERLFKGKTRTEIIHDALEKLIRMNRREALVKKWAGKVHLRDYD